MLRHLQAPLPLAWVVALVAAGCAGPTDQAVDARARDPVVVEGSGGSAVIQGLVLGYTLTAENNWVTEPAGGTRVEYMTYSFNATDSAGAFGPVLGQVTADAQGRFTIAEISDGWYALRFTPPAGSPYQGGVRKINTEEYQGVATFSLLRQ